MDDIRQILVPVDFSEHGSAAIARASQLAVKHDAVVHLLHVVADKAHLPENPDEVQEELRQAREELDRLLPGSGEKKQTVVRRLARGVVHKQIVDYARREGMDLIVMGTHGRGGVVRAVLGSVADHVVRTAPCPVLTVRDVREHERVVFGPPADDAEPPREAMPPAFDLIHRALSMRATDVHIDPVGDDEFLVRMRVDGVLQPYCRLDRDVADHLMQQLRTQADLSIAEPFLPQEGRLNLPAAFKDVEARITSAPVAGGDAVSLRLFDRAHIFRPLEDLGLSEQALAGVQAMVRRGEGLVLVTGPTGAGKTTTVYSMLQALGDHQRNIISIEDPVEFPVAFVRQMAVDEMHGLTMTAGLKTILRMDPDVVFLGEIRDVEAGQLAMRAASSGRHVYSTLHARDVASTITALRDMRVDDRSLSANLTGIVNQRLVRRVCIECAKKRPITHPERERLTASGIEHPPEQIVDAVGCEACRGTGYRGRIGVFETVVVDDEIRSAISDNAPEEELAALLRRKGIRDLSADGLLKASEQMTTIREASEMRWL
jgi:type II secretory ATPase GspE/PulE/Tfp pilus assembly ATPase PilB-like protein/nucleotide-binding universal stress UspA family protein